MATLQELKQEATDLGIEFSANIGAAKLAEKIEGYYKSQETSGEEIQAAVKAKEAEEKSEEKPAVKGREDRYARAKRSEDRARQTRIVTITDNDTRENNQTTVAIANCSNLYFDLGTVYIPLNIPVEIKQGHLDTLLGLEIPLHVKDAKSGLFKTEVRKRYSISYEQIEE
jgi:hypothetical protein